MASKRELIHSPARKKPKDNERIHDDIAEMLDKQLSAIKLRNMAIVREEISTISTHLDSLEMDVKSFNDRFDYMQVTVRDVRKESIASKSCLEELQEKLSLYEDKSRQNNLRLVGLLEGAEGGNTIQFLQTHIPKWIPALQGKTIEIERVHHLYANKDSSRKKARTLIFKLLRYNDRQAIMQGARNSSSLSYEGGNLRFFPDFSKGTSQKRNAMAEGRKRLQQLGIESFLLYPALDKVRNGQE
ncbi:LINE-1 type transposase domain-containing protein 1 [Anabarilius grahami]|uniref:LINE-1 type transposase domain-containing protein 1 n=1 Tax=Anabarilius grahami TaxID=495550 RepID=A0A3N0XXA3_ANAGA|nr:LINE-1 type transposase domain-containing protein 1 [Anabarilius grahami]